MRRAAAGRAVAPRRWGKGETCGEGVRRAVLCSEKAPLSVQPLTALLILPPRFLTPSCWVPPAAHPLVPCSQQNLSNLAWAYAKLAHLDEELMTAIAGKPRAGGGVELLAGLLLLSWSSAGLQAAEGAGPNVTHTAGWEPPRTLQTAPRRWRATCRCST